MIEKKFAHSLMVRLADSFEGSVIKELGDWNEKTEKFAPDIEYEVIVNAWYDDKRWNSVHDLVFLDKSTGKYYHTRYEKGLTESQYLNPFDYDKEGVMCDEVTITQTERTIIETTWEYK